jgi:nucleoside-diphosphate-sugar epimerase
LKIFITGSNGFIGSHLVKKALGEGHEVVGLRLPNHTAKINLQKQPIWIEGTLEDDFSKALTGCDVLIHLAAYGVNPAYDSWQESFRWNVTASLNIWNQAHNAGIKKIIIAGSCSEYGKSAERYEFIPYDAPLEPVNAYGASKATATVAAMAYAREKSIELAVLRLFHVYGDGESSNRFWPALNKAALEGADFPMTLGEQIRDFMPAEQVAEKFLNYATKISLEPGNPIVQNVGTGKPQSLLDFAEMQWTNLGGKGKILPGNIPYRKNEIMRFVPKI